MLSNIALVSRQACFPCTLIWIQLPRAVVSLFVDFLSYCTLYFPLCDTWGNSLHILLWKTPGCFMQVSMWRKYNIRMSYSRFGMWVAKRSLGHFGGITLITQMDWYNLLLVFCILVENFGYRRCSAACYQYNEASCVIFFLFVVFVVFVMCY